MFHHGYTPAKALRSHAKDLKDEYGDQFCKIQGDRFHFPDINWVYRLHDSIFRKEFGAEYGLKMLQNLTEKVNEFKHAKLDVIDEAGNYVVSLVTPFMLRVHDRIKQSSEV